MPSHQFSKLRHHLARCPLEPSSQTGRKMKKSPREKPFLRSGKVVTLFDTSNEATKFDALKLPDVV
jgi:hypothetical protein